MMLRRRSAATIENLNERLVNLQSVGDRACGNFLPTTAPLYADTWADLKRIRGSSARPNGKAESSICGN